MNPYLSNYIQTLTSRRQERIDVILEEARIGKEQLDVVFRRLRESVGNFTPLVLRPEGQSTLIESEPIAQNIRDIQLKVRDLFSVSNIIALLLESHDNILSSEIAALEKELTAMDKMVANFSFLLTDGRSFNYAYLEPFSDENGRDHELDFVADRSGYGFHSTEKAVIRTDEGILTLTEDPALSPLGITVEMIKGNSTGFAIENMGLENIVKPNNKGWRMILSATNPITGALREANGEKGAQVLLEFKVTGPSPASEIKIVPLSDTPVEILSVIIYANEEDATGTEVLTSKKNLGFPLTLHFPMQQIDRFTVLVNQPVYSRKFTESNTVEEKYRTLIEEINRTERDRRSLAFSRKASRLERSLEVYGASRSRPSTSLRPDRGTMGEWVLRDTVRHNNWGDRSESDLLNPVLYSRREPILIDRKQGEMAKLSNTLLQVGDQAPVSTIFSERSPSSYDVLSRFAYFYMLGLQKVTLGVEDASFRGVYVSGALPARGDIGEVKVKVSDENIIDVSRTDRDSFFLTSTEYSVSNISDPEDEQDWIPILPDGLDKVVAERLFLDRYGKGLFRFPSRPDGATIYRNGKLVYPDEYVEIKNSENALAGVQFKMVTGVQDIYTCDYVPNGDPTVVSFVGRGFGDSPALVSAFDDTGAGEFFLRTGSRNSIDLANEPYIDFDLSEVPIMVKLDNGIIAINLTDYTNSTEIRFPTTGYYYIQSGSTLTFNQPVMIPFRVYYQYAKNNVRFRAILRCNDPQFVSPKVDYVHLKAKARIPIPRSTTATLVGDGGIDSV